MEIVSRQNFTDYIRKNFAGISPLRSLQRLFTYMVCNGAQTIASEKVLSSGLNREWWEKEFSGVVKRLRYEPVVKLTKITFSTNLLSENTDLSSLCDVAPLGYCIVATIELTISIKGRWCYVFEAIVPDKHDRIIGEAESYCEKPYPDHYLIVKRQFECRLGEALYYSVIGSYYREQNGITNVCAHACVVTMLNNITGQTLVCPEDLNEALNFNHEARKFRLAKAINYEGDKSGEGGLKISDLRHLFEYFKYTVIGYHYRNESDQMPEDVADEYQQPKFFRLFVYGFIESGFPALFTFLPDISARTDHHVMAIVGHTLNRHSWLPLARPCCASLRISEDENFSPLQWIDEFMVHDEALGVACTLPCRAIQPGADPEEHHNLALQNAMGIFPKSWKIQLDAVMAQAFAATYARNFILDKGSEPFPGDKYIEMLVEYVEFERDGKRVIQAQLKRDTIFRPILVSVPHYIKSLPPEGPIAVRNEIIKRITNETNHIWVIELLSPNMFLRDQRRTMEIGVNPRTVPSKTNAFFTLKAILFWRFSTGILQRKPDTLDMEYFAAWGDGSSLPILNRE